MAVFGKRVDTTITSEHAPAIAWFNGTYYFYMAVNHEGRAIDLYSQWGTDWYQDAQLNSSGWVSRPFLSTASSCASCIKTLNVFWLKYTEPPLVGGP